MSWSPDVLLTDAQIPPDLQARVSTAIAVFVGPKQRTNVGALFVEYDVKPVGNNVRRRRNTSETCAYDCNTPPVLDWLIWFWYRLAR